MHAQICVLTGSFNLLWIQLWLLCNMI